MAKQIVETPLMKQYFEIKAKHPDAILLFRVGDFYETFSEDAIIASQILGITLTKRANGSAQTVELAGFPHHALENYLPKLVRAGKRVAVCDQLEDPKTTKKLVKRGVTELVTPGVALSENVLTQKENNFLAALHYGKSGCIGIAFLDLSTGEFLTTQGTAELIEKLLGSFDPKEVLIERGKKKEFQSRFSAKYTLFELEDWIFTSDASQERLLKQFETQSLKGFGVHRLEIGLIASGAILHYMDLTEHRSLTHIQKLLQIEEDRFMRLDKYTIRSLELLHPINEGGRSLLDILDKTITPMGARLLRRWTVFPLKDPQEIDKRLDVVDYLFKHPDQKEAISERLHLICDMERILAKLSAGRINPREMIQLKISLSALTLIKEICLSSDNESLIAVGQTLDLCRFAVEKIEQMICDDPPLQIGKGDVIKEGVDDELDDLRQIAYKGKDFLLRIQQRESEQTQIPSLKISYNNVFGYYIEVRNTHKDKVPSSWIRKQTLVNAERYITQELKEYEEKILGAEDKMQSIEYRLFNELITEINRFILPIQTNAQEVARLDVLHSFALMAEQNRYIRPVVHSDWEIDIKQGRHPVIEKQLPLGETYVANDVYLNNQNQQIIIITGPNMAGKSALLRQTALIVLMAQMGSYVPAESAIVGCVDKIFTRVGASDNISLGESTFMVEMLEASDILNNVTPRSLVLFDELGRGTSTYDGISIAWAIVEYLHENPKAKAKTLFATHYHELNEMEKSFSNIRNFNVSVREVDNKIIFLRQLIEGGSEHSFGIHVAKIAGMPQSIIHRAQEILVQLEQENRSDGLQLSKPVSEIAETREGMQLSFFQLDDPVLSKVRDEIAHCDVDNLTPVQALNKLSEIKKIIKGGRG